MKVGDYANYVSFLDEELEKHFTIKLVSETKEEWRFQFTNSEDYHLTVSKNVGFNHTWYSGENKTLKRQTIIEPFLTKKK